MNGQGDGTKRDWSIILLLILCFSLIPLWLFSRLLWIAIVWGGSFVLLLRYRQRTKQVLLYVFGGKLPQAIALLIILNIALSFVIIHESTYTGDLHWGIEVGDQFSYSVEAVGYDLGYKNCTVLNNSIVVFEITNLPSIPLYCDRAMFIDSIVDARKAGVTFDNGTSLDSECASILTSLFSNSLLPIGDWSYIDGLYYDRARGGLGAPVQDPWYSRLSRDRFHFGAIAISCVGTFGWSAEISLEDGVPIVFHDYPYFWEGITITLTRI